MIHIDEIPREAIEQVNDMFPELIFKKDEIFYMSDKNKIIHTY